MTFKGTALNNDGSVFANDTFHWQKVGGGNPPIVASTDSAGYFEVTLGSGEWQPDKVVIVTSVVVD